MTDVKKLTAQKTELRELWEFLEIKAEYPSKHIPTWLLDFGKDEIEAAFKQLAKREDQVTAAVKYVGKILNNSKIQNMTVEERAEKISSMRSLVGAIGGRKKHEAELARVRQEFATVCQTIATDLPQFGSGSGSGSGLDFDSATGTAAVPPTAEKPAAASPPVAPPAAVKQKQNQNQNLVHGSLANKKATPKPKTAKDGTPYPNVFDNWSNAKRLAWLDAHDGSAQSKIPGFKIRRYGDPIPTQKFRSLNFYDDEPIGDEL